MAKKKRPQIRRKPRIPEKAGRRPKAGGGQEAPLPFRDRRVRDTEKVRLEGMVHDLSKERNHLKKEVLRKKKELKIKNGQLRNGAQKQIRSEEQIQIRADKIAEQREELLHVTRVGKLAEFVSSLAHEISQPLTAILSYAQAAQRLLAGREPEIHKILSYIVSDDQRASAVIQRLRLLLRKGRPEIKTLDINVVIKDTVVVIATDAAVRNSAVKMELDAGLPLIRGDRIQLQQVLLNLISNSLDALEGSQEEREISIRTLRKDAGTIIVEVSDSGSGIPARDIPKLFTHFFTSKPDGLGMGLSISRSIVEAHGGRLSVRNNPGRGATFAFTLPAEKTGTP
ncbi:MAG: sensor histidine kinase [Deltaproteobacteria bacterium]